MKQSGFLPLFLWVAVMATLGTVAAFTDLPREPEWKRSSVVPVLLPGAQWLSRGLPEWTVQELDFGNGVPAGDNARLHPLPLPLDESGAPQERVPPAASPESKPE